MPNQIITFPGKILHRQSLKPDMLVYGLARRDWTKMKVVSLSTNTAVCEDVYTGAKKLPSMNGHIRSVCAREIKPGAMRKVQKLWFVYGNGGPQHSDHAHHLLQHIIEQQHTDLQHWYRHYAKRTPNECLDQLGDILHVVWIAGKFLLQSSEEVQL